MNKVKRKLIPNYLPFVPKESIELVTKTLKSGWIGGDGPRVKEFETKISKIVQNPNVAAVNSATSGLQMALRTIGIRDCQVITTPMTCFATNAAIVMEGGIPVWADIDPESGNIDPVSIEKLITKMTKAIMVVHWGGTPCNMFEIGRISRKYGIPVVEDAAQALGSTYHGKPIGTHSDFVVFSTQAIKIINTGDGGIVAARNKKDIEHIKTIRWYGIDREKREYNETFWDYPIKEVGSKMNMTDVSASIGLGQLPYLNSHLECRRDLATMYKGALAEAKHIKAQKEEPNSMPNYWIFTVVCDTPKTKLKLHKTLLNLGIKSEEAHRRNDTYPVFLNKKSPRLFGVSKFDSTHLIIPVGHWVKKTVAKEIAKVLRTF